MWNFEIARFFRKTFIFLYSPYEYSNELVGDVIPSQFYTQLLTEMTNNSYFSLETGLLTPLFLIRLS